MHVGRCTCHLPPRGSKIKKTQVVRLGGRCLHLLSHLILASSPLLFPDGKEIRAPSYLSLLPYHFKKCCECLKPLAFSKNHFWLVFGPCPCYSCLKPLPPFLLSFSSSSSFFFSLLPFKARPYSRSGLAWTITGKSLQTLLLWIHPQTPSARITDGCHSACLIRDLTVWSWSPLYLWPCSTVASCSQTWKGAGCRGSGILVFLQGSQVLRTSPCFALLFENES